MDEAMLIATLMRYWQDPAAVLRIARQARGLRQSDLGRICGYAGSQISRWENGQLPLRDIGILRQLAAKLNLPSQVFGLLPEPGAQVLNGQRRSTHAHGRVTVDNVDRHQFLRVALGVTAAAATAHPLAELLTSPRTGTVPAVVGRRDIEEILTMKQVVHDLDHQFGATPLIQRTVGSQIEYCIELIDSARCSDSLRRDLFSAASRLGSSAGFMMFDAYDHENAKKYFELAQEWAEEADDWNRRATALSDKALQELWLGQPENALTSIELAMVRQDRLCHIRRAMLSGLRARALARLGRVEEAVAAVRRADEEFARVDPANEPPGPSHYTVAEHYAETGHAYAALAVLDRRFVREADTRLTTAISEFTSTYSRSRVFSQVRLASLTMKTGDPIQAGLLGKSALATASNIRSGRLTDTFQELRRLAEPHKRVPEVADLRHRIGSAA